MPDDSVTPIEKIPEAVARNTAIPVEDFLTPDMLAQYQAYRAAWDKGRLEEWDKLVAESKASLPQGGPIPSFTDKGHDFKIHTLHLVDIADEAIRKKYPLVTDVVTRLMDMQRILYESRSNYFLDRIMSQLPSALPQKPNLRHFFRVHLNSIGRIDAYSHFSVQKNGWPRSKWKKYDFVGDEIAIGRERQGKERKAIREELTRDMHALATAFVNEPPAPKVVVPPPLPEAVSPAESGVAPEAGVAPVMSPLAPDAKRGFRAAAAFLQNMPGIARGLLRPGPSPGIGAANGVALAADTSSDVSSNAHPAAAAVPPSDGAPDSMQASLPVSDADDTPGTAPATFDITGPKGVGIAPPVMPPLDARPPNAAATKTARGWLRNPLSRKRVLHADNLVSPKVGPLAPANSRVIDLSTDNMPESKIEPATETPSDVSPLRGAQTGGAVHPDVAAMIALRTLQRRRAVAGKEAAQDAPAVTAPPSSADVHTGMHDDAPPSVTAPENTDAPDNKDVNGAAGGGADAVEAGIALAQEKPSAAHAPSAEKTTPANPGTTPAPEKAEGNAPVVTRKDGPYSAANDDAETGSSSWRSSTWRGLKGVFDSRASAPAGVMNSTAETTAAPQRKRGSNASRLQAIRIKNRRDVSELAFSTARTEAEHFFAALGKKQKNSKKEKKSGGKLFNAIVPADPVIPQHSPGSILLEAPGQNDSGKLSDSAILPGFVFSEMAPGSILLEAPRGPVVSAVPDGQKPADSKTISGSATGALRQPGRATVTGAEAIPNVMPSTDGVSAISPDRVKTLAVDPIEFPVSDPASADLPASAPDQDGIAPADLPAGEIVAVPQADESAPAPEAAADQPSQENNVDMQTAAADPAPSVPLANETAATPQADETGLMPFRLPMTRAEFHAALVAIYAPVPRLVVPPYIRKPFPKTSTPPQADAQAQPQPDAPEPQVSGTGDPFLENIEALRERNRAPLQTWMDDLAQRRDAADLRFYLRRRELERERDRGFER